MRLYAVYWKGEEHMLETGDTTWWIKRGSIGKFEDAYIFTKEELEVALTDSPMRTHGEVVEIDV